MLERHTWPAESNQRSTGQTLKENSHEEDRYRRCPDRRFSRPRDGRRLSERLHDPLTAHDETRDRGSSMTNLFPLPYWAPALQRVPIPLPLREERWSLISWLSCQRFDFCLSGMGAL